ncbi:MAG: hypothetical protein Kow0031_04670 [Anaerolineae bacterium]
MNTYSHFLMTALAGDRLKLRNIPVHTKAFLLGSVAPDVPLVALTLGYFAYRYWFDPIQPGEHIFGDRYDNLYFYNPFWIAAHNMLHAPLLIALYAAIGYYATRARKRWGPALFWFALACGFHSAVDIFTHHNDGPVLFFPFEWHLRFPSPISYWHPAYGGRIFAPLELLLDAAIILYFAVAWWRLRLSGGFKRKV